MRFWWKQDREQLHAMDWYNLVAEALADIRSPQKSPTFKTGINSAQCSQLAYIFSSKLSKFWPPSLNFPSVVEDSDSGSRDTNSSSGSSRRQSLSRKSDSFVALAELGENEATLDACEHALKEVYRVIKELEVFMQVCSRQDWWKSALLRADNGEALAVHVHDLVWAVAGLDAAIQHARGSAQESIDALCSRRIAECYSELSCCHHPQNEATDRKQLIAMLTTLEEQFARMSKRRKRTLRVDEENKYRISAFLLRRLQMGMAPGATTSHELPESLSIDPMDIDFSKRRLIGRGSFGAVYEASWCGMKLAVKELPCTDVQIFEEEAGILAKLRSPFIVHLVGWSIHQEANVCHLLMELCSKNLRTHIEKRSKQGPPFSLRVAVDIMLQIARGMEYLHSQRVIHRDLRASNILVDDSTVREFLDEGYVRVKLCDFGMAKAKLNSSRFVSSMKGATYWRAPEVFSDPGAKENEEAMKRRYTDKADVYSFAMTCYEILTGQIPFDGTPHKDIFRFVMSGGRPELPAYCPSLLADYVKRCWHSDDKCRPSFHDICRVLRRVKLILMRANELEHVSLWSATNKFDYAELSNHLHKISVSSGGGRSFKEVKNSVDNQFNVEAEELEKHDTSNSSAGTRRTSPFQRIRSVLSFSSKLVEIDPREDAMLSFLPSFITKYSLQDLRTATANFSERIGSGESGCVFRGVLTDKTVVAVKLVKPHSADDIRLFCTKVAALCNAYHVNVVRFRGFCIESSHFFFVYDYMGNLSLDKWLIAPVGGDISMHPRDSESVEDDTLLDLGTRLRIATGAAQGMAFLHEDCGQFMFPVVLRPSKILLSEQFEAKINNLNLFDDAKNFQFFNHKVSFNKSSSSTLVLSPEASDAQKADVYSFGIVLFEIVMGHTVDLSKAPSHEGLVCLCDSPRQLFQLLDGHPEDLDPSVYREEREISGLMGLIHIQLMDESIKGRDSQAVEMARKLFQTALWCVQNVESRPTMSQVVQILEGTLSIPPQLLASFNAIM